MAGNLIKSLASSSWLSIYYTWLLRLFMNWTFFPTSTHPSVLPRTNLQLYGSKFLWCLIFRILNNFYTYSHRFIYQKNCSKLTCLNCSIPIICNIICIPYTVISWLCVYYYCVITVCIIRCYFYCWIANVSSTMIMYDL